MVPLGQGQDISKAIVSSKLETLALGWHTVTIRCAVRCLIILSYPFPHSTLYTVSTASLPLW